MGQEVVWPILCLALALVLVVAEAFVPSGGIIGLLAFGFLVVSLFLAFSTTKFGWLFVLLTCVLLPVCFLLWSYLWPRMPMAKYLFLKPPDPEDSGPDGHALLLEHMVGQFGRTLTPLRPSGTIDLDGKRHEGIAEEGLIPAKTLVRVVKVRSGRLVVRITEIASLDDVVF
jgi:membrane-bound ClpP family serine protease